MGLERELRECSKNPKPSFSKKFPRSLFWPTKKKKKKISGTQTLCSRPWVDMGLDS